MKELRLVATVSMTDRDGSQHTVDLFIDLHQMRSDPYSVALRAIKNVGKKAVDARGGIIAKVRK